MKEGILAEQTDFASKPLKDHLKGQWRREKRLRALTIVSSAAAQKADQVFLPVLENAMKAQKLRTTLSVFDRSKFFFNLPSSLVECIEAVSGNLACVRMVELVVYAMHRGGMRQQCVITRRASSCSRLVLTSFYQSVRRRTVRHRDPPSNSRNGFWTRYGQPWRGSWRRCGTSSKSNYKSPRAVWKSKRRR